jgi:hypothetical protein
VQTGTERHRVEIADKCIWTLFFVPLRKGRDEDLLLSGIDDEKQAVNQGVKVFDTALVRGSVKNFYEA